MSDLEDNDTPTASSNPTPTPPLHAGQDYPEAEWIPEAALENLQMERTFSPSETEEDLARRIVRENVPAVAQQMVHLAIHSSSETTRLRAGQYLMDRILGRPGDDLKAQGEDPLRDLLDAMADAAEQEANTGSSTPRSKRRG